MTATFIDGFEEFSGSGSPTPLLQRAEWTASGTLTIVQGRSSVAGSAALGGGNGSVERAFPWTGDRFSTGCAFQFSARGSIMRLQLGAAVIQLWANELTGTPMLNAAPGGALPTINRWYYYELRVSRSTGTCELWINNKFDSSIVLPDGATSATAAVVRLGWQDPTTYRPAAGMLPRADTGTKFIDDFYARDGDAIGPIVVTTRFPDIDQNVEWFKASAELSHAASLSQHPPDPLDSYVASDTIGKEDRFLSNLALPNTNGVLATGIVVMARKAPTLNAKLGVFMGGNAGAVAARSDVRTVESDWRTQYVMFEPVGGDTKAGIEASEFGINVTAP
jgi:hypothetical protein